VAGVVLGIFLLVFIVLIIVCIIVYCRSKKSKEQIKKMIEESRFPISYL
jgi:uncharacterized membrane protein